MNAGANRDVLVVGEYYCDLVFAGLGGAPRLGEEVFASDLAVMPGGTYTMALALTRLGVATSWAASFGTDFFSRLVLDWAGRDGLDTCAFSHEPGPVQRVSAAFSAEGERGFISYCAPPVTPPPARTVAGIRAKWLLQTFRFDPDWLAFMAGLKRGGASIFADCRSGRFTLDTLGVRQFLGLVDVFSPNAAEAMALADTDDLDAAIAALAPLVPVLAVKCGAEGARLVADGSEIRRPAPRVTVTDTVGAGDAFNAGFLFGRVNGLDMAGALEAGVLCGTLSTRGTGGRACPTRAELAAFVQKGEAPLDTCLLDLVTGSAPVPARPGGEIKNQGTRP